MKNSTLLNRRKVREFALVAIMAISAIFTPLVVFADDNLSEYLIPTANSNPNDIVMGPDYNMWFTETDANQIGKTSQDGSMTVEYVIPTANSAPTEITVGPDGAMWFIESNAHKIGRITTAGIITEFLLDSTASPVEITTGPDGNLWFTDTVNNEVSRMTTAGIVTDYSVPTVNAGPHGITADVNGYIWFTERDASKIARMNPDTGIIVEYDTVTPGAMPTGITLGYNGNNLYYAESGIAKIGNITADDYGLSEEYALPDSSSVPDAIFTGFDSNCVWFTDLAPSQNRIGCINPQRDHEIWEYNLPNTNAQPLGIVSRSDDSMVWFTESTTNKLGKVVVISTGFSSDIESTVNAGEYFEFNITGYGLPTPELTMTDGILPEGVIFTNNGNGTGVISGTPTETGVFSLTFLIKTPTDMNQQWFTLNVN